MNTEFDITGLFYESNGYKCRKYLDIRRKGFSQNIPDLMVVMMNPGSSYPLDGNENCLIPTTAEPDKTQTQIMKVMDIASLHYARILNLSDLRTPDSKELYKFLDSDKSKQFEHSIFSDNRKEDLEELFIKDVPVIYGWGVNEALIPWANKAVDTLGIKNPLGKLKVNTEYSYYHPLPQNYYAQQEWVHDISNQINRMTEDQVI